MTILSNLYYKLHDIKQFTQVRIIVDANSGFNGRTILMITARCGHHQVCKYLITEQKARGDEW